MTESSKPQLETATLLAAGVSPMRSGSGRWQPPSPDQLVGAFPNLQILELLGVGGMGAVYKARQVHLDRMVAVKLLAPRHAADPGFDERFAREARALARLEHPHIVAVHDFGRVLDRSYLVMQHIDGSNLRQVISTGTLSGPEVLRLVRQLCDALEHAHAAGVVHRDLKPENILIDGRGNAHIADFGLAKLSEGGHELTGTGEVLGTLHYMAPEQLAASAAVDHRADLYALGVIIYEMLTGSLPLGRFAPPSSTSSVTAGVDAVVLRSLEPDPVRRYGSASELRSALEGASVPPAPVAKERPEAKGAPMGAQRGPDIASATRAGSERQFTQPVTLAAYRFAEQAVEQAKGHAGAEVSAGAHQAADDARAAEEDARAAAEEAAEDARERAEDIAEAEREQAGAQRELERGRDTPGRAGLEAFAVAAASRAAAARARAQASAERARHRVSAANSRAEAARKRADGRADTQVGAQAPGAQSTQAEATSAAAQRPHAEASGAPESPAAQEPRTVDAKIETTKKQSKVWVGLDGVHVIDGHDEVRVGWDGVHVKDGDEHVSVGWQGVHTSAAPKPGQAAAARNAGGDHAFFRLGMAMLLAGAVLGLYLGIENLPGFYADPTLHFAAHQDVDLAMFATSFIVAGGIGLLSRCCLPMVLLSAIATILPIPWLWHDHRFLSIIYIVFASWIMTQVCMFARLRDHMASLPWHGRVLRLVWVVLVVGGLIALPVLPWLPIWPLGRLF